MSLKMVRKVNIVLATKCDYVFWPLIYTCLIYTCYRVLLGRLDGLNKHTRDRSNGMDWNLRPRYLRWSKWYCEKFISEFSGFHLFVSFNHFSTLIFQSSDGRRYIHFQLAAPWIKHWKHINTSVALRLWMRPGGQPGWEGEGAQGWVVGGGGWGSCSALLPAVMNIQGPSAVTRTTDHAVPTLYNRCVCVYRRTVWPYITRCVHNCWVLADLTNVLACCHMIPSYQTARHEKD